MKSLFSKMRPKAFLAFDCGLSLQQLAYCIQVCPKISKGYEILAFELRIHYSMSVVVKNFASVHLFVQI